MSASDYAETESGGFPSRQTSAIVAPSDMPMVPAPSQMDWHRDVSVIFSHNAVNAGGQREGGTPGSAMMPRAASSGDAWGSPTDAGGARVDEWAKTQNEAAAASAWSMSAVPSTAVDRSALEAKHAQQQRQEEQQQQQQQQQPVAPTAAAAEWRVQDSDASHPDGRFPGGPPRGDLWPAPGAAPSNAAAAKPSLKEELNALLDVASRYPPPLPVVAPMETRRERAALWHYHASHWDITYEMPPPPRNPLPQMDWERHMNVQSSVGVAYPYRGEGWLALCETWAAAVHHYFRFKPQRARPAPTPPAVALAHCVTA
jgi:hypothetical protein